MYPKGGLLEATLSLGLSLTKKFQKYSWASGFHLVGEKKDDCCLVTKSCSTLCDPMVYSLQAPFSMEFCMQEYWSGLPFPPSEDLPDPGIEPKSSASPAVAGRFFTTEPPGKPIVCTYHISFNLSSGNEHWVFGLFSLFLLSWILLLQHSCISSFDVMCCHT